MSVLEKLFVNFFKIETIEQVEKSPKLCKDQKLIFSLT